MKLINDINNPDLVAVLDQSDEINMIRGWVGNLNKDLADSGNEKYQFKAELVGKKAYIRKV